MLLTKLVLGVAVVTLNGKPTKDSEFGKKVEAVMDLVNLHVYLIPWYHANREKSPTLFPIVFAAITGRSMKMIARYLAEKGTKLSVSVLEIWELISIASAS